MPHFIVERRLADWQRAAVDEDGLVAGHSGHNRNADLAVSWGRSHISDDRQTTFCVCDGPNPESIREATRRLGFFCDEITEIGACDSCSNE